MRGCRLALPATSFYAAESEIGVLPSSPRCTAAPPLGHGRPEEKPEHKIASDPILAQPRVIGTNWT